MAELINTIILGYEFFFPLEVFLSPQFQQKALVLFLDIPHSLDFDFFSCLY